MSRQTTDKTGRIFRLYEGSSQGTLVHAYISKSLKDTIDSIDLGNETWRDFLAGGDHQAGMYTVTAGDFTVTYRLIRPAYIYHKINPVDGRRKGDLQAADEAGRWWYL